MGHVGAIWQLSYVFQCCHIHKDEANPFGSRQPKRLSFLKNLLTPALEPTQPPIQCVLKIFPDGKVTGAWFWLFCPYMPSQLVQGQFYLLPVSWYRFIPLDNINSNYCTMYVFGDRLCGLVVRVSGYRYRGPGFDHPALPDFLSSSGSGTGSTQPREPREVNWGATWMKKVAAPGLENRD